MVRHNNQIPNEHFHKKYKRYIKTWFGQPMQKKRRALIRKRKAIEKLPKPIELLRPIVRCTTIRYNNKTILGRGFSIEEIKAAGLSKNYAKSIGIAVDVKRHNKSIEGKLYNVQRLQEYLNKLIIFPIERKKRAAKKVNIPSINGNQNVNAIISKKTKRDSRIPTKAEKTFGAYKYLRKCRFDMKLARLKLKRELKKNDNLDPMPTKKVRLLEQ